VHLLVIGANRQIANALRVRADAEGYVTEAIETDASGFLSGDELKAKLACNKPNYVINVSLYPAYQQAEADIAGAEKINTAMLAELAKVSDAAGIPFIQLSDAHIFDGKKDGPYIEEDEPRPMGVYGRTLLEGEQQIRALCPNHIILRTGLIFSQWGENYFTEIIKAAKNPEPMVVPAGIKGCPTPAGDVARVVFAIIKQLNCGCNTWGTFHYCSSDVTNSYDFVDAVLSILSQQVGSIEKDITSVPLEDEPSLALYPVNSVLACKKILHAYGIKQRSWRSGLKAMIKEVCPEHSPEVNPAQTS